MRECGHESSGMDGLIPCHACALDATWNAALEAAAKALDREADFADSVGMPGQVGIHWRNSAVVVRNLKRQP